MICEDNRGPHPALATSTQRKFIINMIFASRKQLYSTKQNSLLTCKGTRQSPYAWFIRPVALRAQMKPILYSPSEAYMNTKSIAKPTLGAQVASISVTTFQLRRRVALSSFVGPLRKLLILIPWAQMVMDKWNTTYITSFLHLVAHNKLLPGLLYLKTF